MPFNKTHPDIVMTDWMMKPIDGLALTRRLRDRESSANAFVPVILVTGLSARQDIFKARDTGVNEIVVKPIAPKILYERLVAVIERPRPFVSVEKFFGPDRRRRKDIIATDKEKRGARPSKNKNAVPTQTMPDINPTETMDQHQINALMNPCGPEAQALKSTGSE